MRGIYVFQELTAHRRLEAAFKNFRADVLRKELDDLENNKEKEFLSL